MPKKESRIVHAWRSLSSAREEMELLIGRVADLPTREVRRILVQVLVGSLVRMDATDHLHLGCAPGPWVPIPNKTRKKLGSVTTWNSMIERGIIHRRVDHQGYWYDRSRQRCGEFAVDPAFLARYIRCSFQEAFTARPQWVDLVSGKALRQKKGEYAVDVRAGSVAIGPRARIPLAAMRNRAEWMLVVSEAAGRPDLRTRSLTAMAGLVSIVADPLTTKHRDGWATITAAYREHANGRAYGLSGSVQGLPKEIKQVLLTADGSQWQNLDMSVAHVAGILRVASAINSVVRQCKGSEFDYVNVTLLRQIVEEGWDAYVGDSGLPRGLVKEATLSLFMGSRGWISRDDSDSALGLALHRHVPDVRQRIGARRRLKKFLEPLRKVVGSVRDHLRRMMESVWYKPHGLVVNKGGHRYEVIGINCYGGRTIVRNVLGGEFVAHTVTDGWCSKDSLGRPMVDRVVSQAMSHILTGIERQFMRAVMQGCRDLALPYLDEHDGIAVCGDVPNDVFVAARKQSILAEYAVIRPKPFQSPDDDEYTRLAHCHGIPMPALAIARKGNSKSLVERRRLIEAAIRADPTRSDRDIAREFACSHAVVGRVRRKMEPTGSSDPV